MWDQGIHELRKGDHYLLVLWDLTIPSERPRRDSLRLLGTALLVAAVITVAAVLVAKYEIEVERYRKYVLIGIVGLILLASRFFIEWRSFGAIAEIHPRIETAS